MKNIIIFILFCLASFGTSICPAETIVIQKSYVLTSQNISSQCTLKFQVGQFSKTQVLASWNLTGSNKVTIRQNYAYGSKIIEISNSTNPQIWSLPPTNFDVDVQIQNPNENEQFFIIFSSLDYTPYNDAGNFEVDSVFGTIIDSTDLAGNSTISRKSAGNLEKVSIRVVTFSDVLTNYVMDKVLIFEGDIFMGTLYDVQKSETTCYATNLKIVNTNSGLTGIYSILISSSYNFQQSEIIALAHPYSDNLELSATNGLTVFHDITSPIIGGVVPMVVNDFEFRGDGFLQIFAGCITQNMENLRLATINASTSQNYKNLQIYGRCRTFVLTQGKVTLSKQESSPTTYKYPLWTNGVIMDADYPLSNSRKDPYTMKFLIQAPDSNTNIGVTYDIVYIAPNVQVEIEQDIQASKNAIYDFSSANTSLVTQLSPSYQQMVTINVPSNSKGVFIRFQVIASSASLSVLFIFGFSFLISMLL